VFVLAWHPKLRALLYVLILGQLSACCDIVDAGIENVNPASIFGIEPSDIGALVQSFNNDSNPMQRCMAWVKDVSGHTVPDQTDAA
jgi:hypothetical protein